MKGAVHRAVPTSVHYQGQRPRLPFWRTSAARLVIRFFRRISRARSRAIRTKAAPNVTREGKAPPAHSQKFRLGIVGTAEHLLNKNLSTACRGEDPKNDAQQED
jgi:hypothetical protein